jgi:hypothetical protein
VKDTDYKERERTESFYSISCLSYYFLSVIYFLFVFSDISIYLLFVDRWQQPVQDLASWVTVDGLTLAQWREKWRKSNAPKNVIN